MRVATPVPEGKLVISSMPMIFGFQSDCTVVSTAAENAAAIQLERAPSRFAVYHLSDTRTLRWSPGSQQICTAISAATLFQQLASQWRKERGATSSITRMATSPAYQRIVGLGEKAIPLILRQLENEGDDPDHWFWALQAITGENPIPENARGDMPEMARAWLDWAYMAG